MRESWTGPQAKTKPPKKAEARSQSRSKSDAQRSKPHQRIHHRTATRAYPPSLPRRHPHRSPSTNLARKENPIRRPTKRKKGQLRRIGRRNLQKQGEESKSETHLKRNDSTTSSFGANARGNTPTTSLLSTKRSKHHTFTVWRRTHPSHKRIAIYTNCINKQQWQWE